LVLDDALPLLAEAFHGEADGLTWAEKDGRWFLSHADAGWRAGRDDVAGVQRHELA
jgi:hypothetical protein